MRFTIIFITALLFVVSFAANARTLAEIRKAQILRCGVSTGQAGFSEPDSHGVWYGFDVTLCKAISIALFGNDTKDDIDNLNLLSLLGGSHESIRYVPLLPSERVPAVIDDTVDLLFAKIPVTFYSEIKLGISFPAISYYDGQTFLVRKSTNIKNAWRIPANSSVCVRNNSVRQARMDHFFSRFNISIRKVIANDIGGLVEAFNAGECDVITGYQTNLAELRLSLNKPDQAEVLTQLISRRPLGPAVKAKYTELSNFVRFVISVLIEAEYIGIDSNNVASVAVAGSSVQKNFLQISARPPLSFGFLEPNRIETLIGATGNYGEIFNRNLGEGSPLAMSRGINRSWFYGGLLLTPPIANYEAEDLDPFIDLEEYQYMFEDITEIQKLLSAKYQDPE